MSNPLVELAKLGQSIWFDQMERKLVSTGRLQKMIDEDDLRGLTSNPTIFEKAIGGSEDYDSQLRELAAQGKSRDEIYDELVLRDIAAAADVFRPVYDRTNGSDGFVSIEVSPLMARDTAATIAEAKRLFARLGRPNVMIKIPATPEGIPAIEEAIASGINVNITLIFSNSVYEKVMEAYIRGLERRAEKGEPIGDINSVASFFVSRIDSMADKQLEEKAKTDPSAGELLGKVAIANAKLAYQEFKRVFSTDRFLRLRDKGAKVQRPLWASTGTKNPAYSDVLYVDSLIGPDTVNTVPPATYDAYRDHGTPRPTLEEGVDEAKKVLAEFAAKGLDLIAITEKLTAEGVKSFDDSFISLMQTIEARRDEAVRGLPDRVTFHLGSAEQTVKAAVDRTKKDKFVERIWKKDASLWKGDPEHAKIIGNSLGWLSVPEEMAKKAHEVVEFAKSVSGEFDFVVVLGMGGSSLCSEVTARVFNVGPTRTTPGPKLLVLDSTVPEAVKILEAQIVLEKTLFIVASKSGTTTEPVMFHRYFYDRVKSVRGERAGEQFIAITDGGTQMVKDAERDRFRRIFINWGDIGGRYSALSYFGMVPAALAGVDIVTLLDRATHAAHVAAIPNIERNPPARLGAVLGALAAGGRDKLTLITPKPLDTLGLWVEQLIAESTGKEGKGIVPIAGEPPLAASEYGQDRLFVVVRMRSSDESARIQELTAAGHPVIDIVLEEPLDIGEIFYLFEFATAVAGALMGINAFDQPNVQESKDNTKRLLDEFKAKGTMTAATGDNGATRISVSDTERIAELLGKAKPGDYVALTEYFAATGERDKRIAEIREELARALRVATTTGYGPRFLHSTGQLHKGGADNGVFLQLTGGAGHDVAIPGEPFGFGALVRAQAIGDFESLAMRNRRAVSIDLGEDIEAGLEKLKLAVKRSVKA